uniref:subtilisin n=1 Tax=Skeletonema marinoi TaxID=267567 RepID=A0A7S2LU14_9STRA|mmetsp:Transcript_29562/g.50411  ORF Transcript_29562/g.50411 Transcript_29562/m.50411 type:complete len:1393 (+) Transcript_29562:82-4260(+)
MTFLSKGALALSLCVAASAAIRTASAAGDFTASDSDFNVLSEEEAVDPYDLWDSGATQTLLVSYATVKGHEEVVAHSKKPGKKMKEQNVVFAKAQKHKAGKSEKADSSEDDGDKKGKGKARKLRWLQEDGAITTGFSILELETDDLEAEIAALSELEGVTAVEMDTIMHIESMEYQQKLRGGGGVADHIREIQDSIRATAEQFPDDEIEFSPNLEGEEAEAALHGRRLAETTPYGINLVNASHVWSKTAPAAAEPIKICVVDTGYDLGHPDLPSDVAHNVSGWHQVNSDGSTPFNLWDVDGHGHGTHCAGTIGAIGNNEIGVTSVNPDPTKFQFFIGKGLSNSGSGSNANVVKAVEACVNAGAKVISMSLGGSGYSSVTDTFYKDQYDKGVLVIAAAGNSGRDSWGYPAGYSAVVSVGSVMSSRSLSSFSTRNEQVEITGPGHSVLSTHKNNGYTTMSGTSMACPHVAGVAALLWTHFPQCTNNQIRNAMIQSSREPPSEPRNTAGWDKYYGWGIVNAGDAYELLKQGCEVAGGATDPPEGGELHDLALGGKDQKNVGCTIDAHCEQGNPCLGEFVCNAGTCEQVAGSAPVCDDGLKCTIDTCDPSKPYDVLTDLCVFTPKPCEDGNKCNGIRDCDEATGNCYEKDPVVDCNDGNFCTTDTCNPSTGVCSNTAVTCNDNNACTLNDTCDPAVGCIFGQPQADCCGNAECEADETETTCPLDCGTSLTTSFDTSIANRVELGPMFDIATKAKNLTIAGFDLNCYVPEGIESKVFVYSLPGGNYGDNGNWHTKSRWDKVLETSISCNGFGTPTFVALAEGVAVPKNSKHSFFINIYTDSSATGYWFHKSMYPPSGKTARYSPLDEDSYLQIQTGSGNYCISGFCAMISPRRPAITIHYATINDSPTTSPTISSMPSTPVPTFTPTTKPTPLPTTLAPTPVPTATPTPAPTSTPTVTPSTAPSESLAPTPFEPMQVTIASPPTNGAHIVSSYYFDVQGGTVDSILTNMKITTYASSQAITVFAKRGTGKQSEGTPCDWELVAETAVQSTGYWKTIYPNWTNGFKPVELFAGETISLHVTSTGRLLGKYSGSSSLKYNTAFMTTPSTHTLPGTKLFHGSYGKSGMFKNYPSYYSARTFMGALDFETVAPGSTMSPTSAPTAKFSPNQVESTGADTLTEATSQGIQFDIHADSSAIILRKLNMLVEAGSHFVEVWYRNGSYKGSSSGCAHHNNWCNQWTKAAGGDITSTGGLTSSPALSILVSPGQTIGLTVVFPKAGLVVGGGVGENSSDGVLTIVAGGAAVTDYYGNEVNSIHVLNEDESISFRGVIDYDLANSFCASISVQNGVMSDVDDDEPDVTGDDVTNPDGPDGDGDGAGGPMDGDGPMDGYGDGFDSLS